MGKRYTAGFMAYCENYGSVCTCTCHGYGVCRYGCRLGFSDLWVTHAEHLSLISCLASHLVSCCASPTHLSSQLLFLVSV